MSVERKCTSVHCNLTSANSDDVSLLMHANPVGGIVYFILCLVTWLILSKATYATYTLLVLVLLLLLLL